MLVHGSCLHKCLPGLCAVALSAARNRSRGKQQTARQGKDKDKEDPTKMKWVDGWMVRSVKFRLFFLKP